MLFFLLIQQFGDYPAACPVAALLQATSLFVSTLSITAIALDRRKLIVYPHEAPYSTNFILTLVPVIWMCAIGLSSPMAIWKKLEYWTAWADHISLMRYEVHCNVLFLDLNNIWLQC